MARFLFKDIEFPDDKHYRKVMNNLRKDYEADKNSDPIPQSQLDQVYNLQTSNVGSDIHKRQI